MERRLFRAGAIGLNGTLAIGAGFMVSSLASERVTRGLDSKGLD